MPAIDINTAQEHLSFWLKADKTVSLGQSYRYGERWLTRADSAEIRKNIKFWRNEVEILENAGSITIHRVIPVDF